MLKRPWWLLGGFLLCTLPTWAISHKTDSLLRVLDYTLAHQSTYDQQRLSRLAALTAAFHARQATDAARFDAGLLIYDEYQVFKYDSAFAYAIQLGELARKLRSPNKQQTARLKIALTLRSAGLFKEFFDTLQTIRVQQLAPSNRAEYYELCSKTYAELADFDQNTYYQKSNIAKSLAYADSTGPYYQLGSYAQLMQRLFSAKQQADLNAGIAAYRLLRQLPLLPHQQAIITSSLSKLYEDAGQHEMAFQLMILAAIGDLQSATKEGIALFRVSDYCYQEGDLQRAYQYISRAKKTASFFQARHRLVQMSSITSLIDGQKISIVEQQRQQAKLSVVVIGVLAALLLGLAFIIHSQLRRLQRTGRLLGITNEELQDKNSRLQALNTQQQTLNTQLQELNQGLNEANHIKEEYIGYYFSNTSRYIDKLGSLQNKLSTLLTTKQLPAAQQLLKTLDMRAERADLFKGFDSVFMRLFPNFVQEFNTLFPEADRIHLTDDHLLTPELRIFALIRLGITDTEQVSRILGYSIHTVYAYKTRVKNRSYLPNEAFEARVIAIQATQGVIPASA